VTLGVAANAGAARTGTVVVAGVSVAIAQAAAPAPCVFVVSSTGLTLQAAAQTLQLAVTVTQGSSCAWSATSGASFMTVSSGGSQTNSGTVTFAIAANAGAQRTGVLTVAGQTVTIIQLANPCSFSVARTPPATSADLPDAHTITFAVTASAPSCSWTASSSVSFATIAAGAAGTGSGPVTVQLSANSGVSRQGVITIAGQQLPLAQLSPLLAVLKLWSDAGDSVGQGQTLTYTLQQSDISFFTNTPPNQLWFTTYQVTLNTPAGAATLRLDAASSTGYGLGSGLYSDVAKAGAQPPSQPGLLFTLAGRSCSVVSGRFVIGNPIDFQPETRPQNWHVVFEQHCEGGLSQLIGELWISGAGVTTPPALSLPGAFQLLTDRRRPR
jgi:hypothetical protein